MALHYTTNLSANKKKLREHNRSWHRAPTLTTKTAGMASYSEQINRQQIFFSINVKLTNTLLLPVNQMDVRNTAWQTLWLSQVGESLLLWLLVTTMLEIALPGFFMWSQKADRGPGLGPNRRQCQFCHRVPGERQDRPGECHIPNGF